VSSAQQPASQTGQSDPSGGRPAGVPPKPDLYRSPVAPVVWWVWVVFALANLADIAVQGHDHFAAVIAAILILITGVAYVTAFRPRVLADDTGITIRNPLRDHQVPWACVQNVDLGDSLQVHCAWQDGEQKTKLLYGWAVHSPRRARLKAEARARRSDRAAARQSASYQRLPAEARQAMTKTDAEHIATALRQRAVTVRAAGADAGKPAARWNRPAIAALVLPALLLILIALV
jgi:Bacterial PH domain